MWLDDYALVDCSNVKWPRNPRSTSKRDKQKKITRIRNTVRYRTEFMEKLDVALRRYKIKDLPETVSERLVLQSMLFYGNVVFFKDPQFGDNVFALPGVPYGGFNINGDFTKAYVYAKNGLINKEVDLFIKGADDADILKKGINSNFNSTRPQGVMVWENKQRYPFLYTVDYFAYAIADTYRTIDVAKQHMKRPYLIVAEESLVEAIEEALDEMEENERIIPLSTGIKEVTKVDFHDIIGTGENVKDAIELLDWYEQKYREKCAITSNTQVDKKGENLISDEINMNEDYIAMRDETILDYIQSQLDWANECLGTNMKVEVDKKPQEGAKDESDNNDNRDDA